MADLRRINSCIASIVAAEAPVSGCGWFFPAKRPVGMAADDWTQRDGSPYRYYRRRRVSLCWHDKSSAITRIRRASLRFRRGFPGIRGAPGHFLPDIRRADAGHWRARVAEDSRVG